MPTNKLTVTINVVNPRCKIGRVFVKDPNDPTNVVQFRAPVHYGYLDPAMVLAQALEAGFQYVLVIGVTNEDEPYYVSSSSSEVGEALLAMEMTKKRLLETG